MATCPLTPRPRETRDFFWYNARDLAIDPAKPWQLCSRNTGAICGLFREEFLARRCAEAMQKDKDAGRLPCDLSQWEHRSRYLEV